MDTTRSLKKFALTLAALFIVIVAVILNLDQLYLMAAVLGLLPVTSYAVGRAMMRGLDCRRASLPACQEGEQVAVTLTLHNTGRLPKLYLRVQERLPDTLQRVGGGAPLLLQLLPGEAADVSYVLEAQKRGAYQIGPVQVTSTDPLGFYAHAQTVASRAEMLVYPQVLPLHGLAFMGAYAGGHRDLDSAPAAGGGLDFHGVRPYQPGDELRRVHWRTTARTGKLAVMEYTQGAASEALVALDLNGASYADTGVGRESAIEYAIKMASSACDFLLRAGHAVRVVLPALPGAAAWDNAPKLTSLSEMPVLLERLARADAVSTETLAESFTRTLPLIKAGTTILYITPDAGSRALQGALEQCAARGAHAFGYALDGASFRPAPRAPAKGRPRAPVPALPAFTPPPGALPVRQGDNLTLLMEAGQAARR